MRKKDLPKQAELCQKLGFSSPKTYRAHLDALVKHGYVIEEKERGEYVLPNKEDVFLYIPLETLKFLNDTLKENVIKIYIYFCS